MNPLLKKNSGSYFLTSYILRRLQRCDKIDQLICHLLSIIQSMNHWSMYKAIFCHIFVAFSTYIFEKNQFTWLKTVHYVQVKLSKIKIKHLEYVQIKPIFNTQCFIPISYLRSHTHNHASQ